MKYEFFWKGMLNRITGWLLLILLLSVLPIFAGTENTIKKKVKEETLSIKALKEDTPEKVKSAESKESAPADSTPDPAKAKASPVKEKTASPVDNKSLTSSPEPESGEAEKVPATTDDSGNKGNSEGTPESAPASPLAPMKDDYLFGKEDTGYTGVKLNFPLYIGSILIVSLITIVSIKFLGKYMGIPQVGGSQKSMIKILEKQTLGPNKQFCIVEVPGKTVLIGVTENEMKVLCELDFKDVKSFGEIEDKPATAGSSSTNYIVDVLLRKWQGGK